MSRNAVKGLLKSKLGESVNDVNAKFLADRIGITVNENKTTKSKGFTSLIIVEVKTATETRKVAGTLLNGLGGRIVRVDDFIVDVVPAGYLLFIRHKDQPGAIGRVGTLLATEGINIAAMQVGRSEAGGDAIMMLSIDKHVEDSGIEQLKGLEDIYDATPIDL